MSRAVLAIGIAGTACSGAVKPYVLLVAAGGQSATYPSQTDSDGKTMIAPLGCKAGVGEACLRSVHEGDSARSADGKTFHIGRRTQAWNCDTHDVKPDFYAVFESDIQVPENGAQLLVTNGAAPVMSAPGSSTLDVDLDGDGVTEHVAMTDRNAALSIKNGRTGAEVRVKSASGLSIVHLVGAADVRGDGKKQVIFREGEFYRAVGADGVAFDLGFGCYGA